MKNQLPEALKKRLEEILGSDDATLIGESCCGRIRAFRVNTLKAQQHELVEALSGKGFVLEKIPWIDTGFWVENTEGLDDTPEYFLGHYYIQDAASMLPPIILNPTESDVTLDLTAAPGSKTTDS